MRAVALGLIIVVCGSATGQEKPPRPTFRVIADGFKADADDIKAICESAGSQLWRHFTKHPVPAFLVKRGRAGPFFMHAKNERGELVILLDTEGSYWSQYAYQFAHEACHLLCGNGDKDPRHLWFEETLAETASLYALRAMAREWKTKPPYRNWKDYRDSLREYADKTILDRPETQELHKVGLPEFFRTHARKLEKDAHLRGINGAMAAVLLPLFEKEPKSWEAVRWLNDKPPMRAVTFRDHLAHWHRAVPERHKAFVARVAALYGFDFKDG